jgi:exodeoxyribonuclease VIII
MIEQNKIITDLSNEDYHASMALSSSNLKDMLISPYHYWYKKNALHKTTPALLFGTLLHTMLLEPHLFDKEYFVMEKPKRVSKIGKALYSELDIERGTRIWITPEDHSQAQMMIGSLMSNKMVKSMLERSEVEQSLFFKDKQTGVDCKVRADAISLKDGIVLDLKSTAISANEEDFKYTVRKYKYDLSANLYLEGFESYCGEPLKFIWLVVEKTPPFSMGLYMMSPEVRHRGQKQCREALALFERAKRAGGFEVAHNDGRIVELVA